MCTVSFIPIENKVFITTNRDESILRLTAKPPACYHINHQEMMFPKDGNAGGTWVIVCKNGNAGVLLNGAFKTHIKQTDYKKSRGLVLLEIMAASHPVEVFKKYNFILIEPFTLVLLQYNMLYECRWDGQETYIKTLDRNMPHLWSSSTLYNTEIQVKRDIIFKSWLSQLSTLTEKDIIGFHKTLRYEKENIPIPDFQVDIKTVSITSLQIQAQQADVWYFDQLEDKEYAISMQFKARGKLQQHSIKSAD